MSTTFARLSPRLQEALVSQLGWTALRPVQELAGEAILGGKNVVVLAPTAGGKTEAAMFPVLSEMMERPAEGVNALYIAPLKALLNNQEERLGRYAEMVGLRSFVWHGDTPEPRRRAFVHEPAELLMITPESLEVMLISPRVPVGRLFGALRFLVVDEVHALAGTDRGAHLLSVVERLRALSQNDVQRIGLSATVGNPGEILRWLQGSSEREGCVVDPPKGAVRRELLVLRREAVGELARDAARMAAGKKSLFFCQSRAFTEAVAERMRVAGVEVYVHHSSVSLEERRLAEEKFHHGRSACIVCTSTLELGIDVGDLDVVMQANAPGTVSSFLQRMGRTGRRAGQSANTTFFCETAEDVLQAIAVVELAREGWVESVPPQTRCWPVLVHQLMALTLQHGAIDAEACWAQLSVVPDFGGIGREEFEELIEHLVKTDHLFRAGGKLSLGEQAERVFGRRNFMELYAVFSSPVLYRVQTAQGQEIGSIEQDFVDRLVEEMTSFLLGGRAWTVERISHGDWVVRVRPAPSGKRPSWGGFLPRMLGREVCQRIRQVLAEEEVYPYLHPTAVVALKEKREELGPLLRRGGLAHQGEEGGAVLWTFAGGRVNQTLKYGIEWLHGWRVAADNFRLRIEGEGVTHESVRAAMSKMAEPSFWDDEAAWQEIVGRLPAYRLSKFQQALPARLAREMVGRYLLDSEGARLYSLRGGM